MEAEVLGSDTPERFARAVDRAVAGLREGQVVALPTETVYGLAANALDRAAVQRLFEVKGRPAHNPVIVHVVGLEMARGCVTQWPALAERLAKAFWPGPLTLVLFRAACIPEIVSAGGPTVGVRWPSHPLMQAVIRQCGFPLAAPSANPANQLSPTCAEHVRKRLGRRIPLIVDGGPSHVGIESTVLDLTSWPPRVLRPGMIHDQGLLAVAGELAQGPVGTPTMLKSPGLLPKHYAPAAKLVLWSWADEAELRARVSQALADRHAATPASGQTGEAAVEARDLSRVFVIAYSQIPSGQGFGGVSVIPRDAEAFARAIYGELHRCDESDAQLIIVEAPPQTSEWRAIADRLRRASVPDL